VSSAWSFIHQRRSNRSIFIPKSHCLLYVFVAADWSSFKSFNINSHYLVLSDLQAFCRSLFRVDKQVLNLLIIYFHHRNLYLKTCISPFLIPDSIENFFTNLRNYSSIGFESNHRVGFSGACLTIRKQTAMIAFPGIVENFFSEQVVDVLLVCVRNSTSLALFGRIWGMIPFRVCNKTIKRPKTIVESKISIVSIFIRDGGFRSTLNIILTYHFDTNTRG